MRLGSMLGAEARSWLRRARAQAFEWSGLNARARARLDGSRAVVLLYHRVLPSDEARRLAVEPGMFVTPETFERHLGWLADGFHVLPLYEIVERLFGGAALPEGACAITFDDGWRDNLTHALPALARRGLPATVFVVSQRVGTAGGFWPDEVCRRLALLDRSEAWQVARTFGAVPSVADPAEALLARWKSVDETARARDLEAFRRATPEPPEAGRELLDWEELGQMAAAGFDVESHGASHAMLTAHADEAVRRDLGSARERLREAGHGRHDLLAYPFGAHDARVAALAREVGYRAAVTTTPGLLASGSAPMRLPRVGLHEDVTRSRAEFLRFVPWWE
jgi:peptidoglycan/xylan/chitin deacetylase (PgdA/CDA1 family)